MQGPLSTVLVFHTHRFKLHHYFLAHIFPLSYTNIYTNFKGNVEGAVHKDPQIQC